MFKKLISLFLVILLVSLNVVSVNATDVIDPGLEYAEQIENLGYDFDSLPIEEEILEDGTIKIWHVISYVPEDPHPDSVIFFIDVDHLEDEILFSQNKKYSFHLERSRIAKDFATIPLLVDGIRYYVGMAPGEYVYGDINGDGIVDTKDVLQLRRYIAKLDDTILGSGDLDYDGFVGMRDVFILRQFLLGNAIG